MYIGFQCLALQLWCRCIAYTSYLGTWYPWGNCRPATLPVSSSLHPKHQILHPEPSRLCTLNPEKPVTARDHPCFEGLLILLLVGRYDPLVNRYLQTTSNLGVRDKNKDQRYVLGISGSKQGDSLASSSDMNPSLNQMQDPERTLRSWPWCADL